MYTGAVCCGVEEEPELEELFVVVLEQPATQRASPRLPASAAANASFPKREIPE